MLACLAIVGFAQIKHVLAAEEVDFNRQKFDIPAIEVNAKIDGVMDEAHWQNALKVDLAYETWPEENKPAAQKTSAYIYENGAHLYVAFRAEETEMGKLRAYIRDRDIAYQDDFVGIQFDTFNDEQRAYEFFVNAYGSQMDLIYDENTRNEDDSWDAIWDSAATRDSDGYTVEIKIPFSSLSFPAGKQAKTWNIEFLRVHPRGQRNTYRNSPRNRSRNCTICQWHQFVGFENAEQGNQLELNPVLTVATSESRSEITDELESDGTDYEPGLNIRWGITPQTTLNATINPDFSQVEADDAQLDVNNTFALFFDEKRPFFQEGSDYFNTLLNAIYTRNVADPEYGAKLTGKTGSHTLGLFAVRDEVTNVLIPGTFGSDFTNLDSPSNNLATRYRYDINQDLNVGGILTVRDAGDYENRLVGVDGTYRWNDKHRLRFQYLTSDTDNNLQMQNDFDLGTKQSGDGYRLNYNYNSRNTFIYSGYSDFDKDFRADLGFITQVNYDKFVIGGGYVWFFEDKWWDRIELGGDWDITHDNDGELLEKELEGRVEVNGPLQSYFELGFMTRDRRFDEVLFDENRIYLYGEARPFAGVELRSQISAGDRIDFTESVIADSFSFEPSIQWSVNEHLAVTLRHTYRSLESENRRKLTANLSDLRVVYQFSNKSFLRLVAQYEDVENEPLGIAAIDNPGTEKRLNKQLLYSYKLNPRTVFFLGYSDLADNEARQDNLQMQQRGLFMKLGYVFDY